MDDLISRQAAIDIIEDFPHGDVWNVESMEEMVDRIKQLPPIQPVSCSEFPNNSDVVDRQKAKNAICNACGKIDCDEMDTCEKLDIPSEGSKALEWQYHSYIPHNKYCPKKCFRAKLVRDLQKYGKLAPYGINYPISWMHFKGTEECKKREVTE